MIKIILLLLTLNVSFASLAQDRVKKNEVVKSLRKLRNNINQIDCLPPNSICSDLTLTINFINKQILSVNNANQDYPIQYIHSLEYFTTAFENLTIEDSLKQKLSLLRKDLNLKFKVSGSNMATVPNNKLAAVHVIAKNNSGPVHNLRVHCSPSGFRVNYSNPFLSFGHLTSPAIHNLVPGFYTFWLIHENTNTILGKTTKEIIPGETNKIEISVIQ
jgi:hypothetical protein